MAIGGNINTNAGVGFKGQRKKPKDTLTPQQATTNAQRRDIAARAKAQKRAIAAQAAENAASRKSRQGTAASRTTADYLIATKDKEGIDPSAARRLFGGSGGGGSSDTQSLNAAIRQKRSARFARGAARNRAKNASDRTRISGNITSHQSAQRAYETAKASGADEATLAPLRAAAGAASTRLPGIGHQGVGGKYSTYNPKIASHMRYRDPDDQTNLTTLHGVALSEEERDRFAGDKKLGVRESHRVDTKQGQEKVIGLQNYMNNLKQARADLIPEQAQMARQSPGASAVLTGPEGVAQQLAPTVEANLDQRRQLLGTSSTAPATKGFTASDTGLGNAIGAAQPDLDAAIGRLAALNDPATLQGRIDQSQQNLPTVIPGYQQAPPAAPAAPPVAGPVQPPVAPVGQGHPGAGAPGLVGPSTVPQPPVAAGPLGPPGTQPAPSPFAGASAYAGPVPGVVGPGVFQGQAGPQMSEWDRTMLQPSPETLFPASGGAAPVAAQQQAPAPAPQAAPAAAPGAPAQAPPNPFAPTPGTNPMDPYNMMLQDFRDADRRAKEFAAKQALQPQTPAGGDFSNIRGRTDPTVAAGKVAQLADLRMVTKEREAKIRAIDEAIGGSDAIVKKGDAALVRHSDVPARIKTMIQGVWGDIDEGWVLGSDYQETEAFVTKLEREIAGLNAEQKLAVKRYFATEGADFATKIADEITAIQDQWWAIGGDKKRHAQAWQKIYDTVVTGGLTAAEASSVGGPALPSSSVATGATGTASPAGPQGSVGPTGPVGPPGVPSPFAGAAASAGPVPGVVGPGVGGGAGLSPDDLARAIELMQILRRQGLQGR